MKTQSFQVRTLKNQIQACLRLIELKVKSAVLRLLELEEQLREELKKAMPETTKTLNEKAQLIKDRLILGLNKWECDENPRLVKETLAVINECNDSEYWIKWGYELITERNWKSNGFAVISKAIRNYAKKKVARLLSSDPIDTMYQDLNDAGLSVKEWENYGKKRLYLYDEFGESFGYVDVTSTPKSCATGEFAAIVNAIVDNANKAIAS